MSTADPGPTVGTSIETSGDAHLKAYLELVATIRPQLLRYCSRMVGSLTDGEDLVQESIAQAYFKFSLWREGLPLRAWLLRIAHNKCIDFLRQRGEPMDSLEDLGEAHMAAETQTSEHEVRDAFATLLTLVPPRQRACIVLKDVLGFSLQEIAAALACSVELVKVSLHRARKRLQAGGEPVRAGTPGRRELLETFARLYNAHDWDGVSRLLSQNVEGEVVDLWMAHGKDIVAKQYVGKWSSFEPEWRMSVERLLNEDVVVSWIRKDGEWRVFGLIKLGGGAAGITLIRDYLHVPYVAAAVEELLDLHASP